MAISANVKMANMVARQAHADTNEVRSEVKKLAAQVAILQDEADKQETFKARLKVIVDGGIVVIGIILTIVLVKCDLGWFSAPIGAAPTAAQVVLERIWKL